MPSALPAISLPARPARAAAALAIAALSALLGFGRPAHADMPVIYKDGDRALFSVAVPDFWSVRAGGPREIAPPGSDEARPVGRVISMRPETERRVWVGFQSPAGLRNLDDGEAYLRGIGPFLVRDPRLTGEKRALTIGGRPARAVSGTGRIKGRKVNFTAVVIALPGRRVAVSVSVFESGADPAFADEVNAIYASFRALP